MWNSEVYLPGLEQENSYIYMNKSLKVVSSTSFPVCFVCLKEMTCETMKNGFYFTLKALFLLKIIKFYNFSSIQMSWRHQMPKAWNTKDILLNNLRSKHSLVMKFGHFIQYYKGKFSYQKVLGKILSGN